jgi:hypothetical protein
MVAPRISRFAVTRSLASTNPQKKLKMWASAGQSRVS